MKKITSLLVLVLIVTTSTFATNPNHNVNETVLSSFNQRFAQAKEVSWSKADRYLQASFRMNDQLLTAFFTASGELMGVSRNLLTSQLPINLQNTLTRNFANTWVTELFELATESETTYYITVENGDQQVTYKSSGSTNWTFYRKTKKI